MREFSGVDSIRTFFGGKEKSAIQYNPFGNKQKKPPYPFDTADLTTSEQWPVLTDFDFIQANIKPVEATPLELGYEIDRLKNEVQKQTDAKNKAINSHHDYMDEYRKLENDFYNRGTEIKKLRYVDEMNVLLMKQNLELREQLAKLEHG